MNFNMFKGKGNMLFLGGMLLII